MNVWGRTKMAVLVGWNAFKDPGAVLRNLTREERVDLYSLAWAYYRQTAFANHREWASYITERQLYRLTRLIYNPVTPIVDFYADNIWLAPNETANQALVTPLEQETDEQIIDAIAQIDQWSGFRSSSLVIKRYAAATGCVLVEGIDDLGRQKVLHNAVWPGYVTDIELNDVGDVQSYTLEYTAWDRAAKTQYTYRKEVTKETFSYFRDGRPFIPEGRTAEVEPNPYGFVFAVWIKHADDGGDYGLPAMPAFHKVDEINSLASHLHDNIHKMIESPKVISTDGVILPISGASAGAAEPNRQGRLYMDDPRYEHAFFKTGQGAGVLDLAGSLKLGESQPYLRDAIESLNDDYPELQAAAIIRENSQLSGAALERMLTPAQNKLDSAQAGYNAQLVKLRQMQLAVAGMRANGGGWMNKTKQQDLFRPFSLNSYAKGELDFAIRPASLVGETEAEQEDLLMKKAARAGALEGIIDRREQLRIAGFSDVTVEEILKREEAAEAIITEDEADDIDQDGEGKENS